MKTIWYALGPNAEAIAGPSLPEARQKARDGGGGGWTIGSRKEPVEV